MQSISVFLDIGKFADFQWKMLMSVELWKCAKWLIHLLDLLYVRYSCAKFRHCRIFATDFREKGFLPPHPCSALKKLILNRVKDISDNGYFEISRPYVNIGDDESMTIYELHGLVTPTLTHAINVFTFEPLNLVEQSMLS